MLIHIIGVVPQSNRDPSLLSRFDLDRDCIGIGGRRLTTAVTNAYARADLLNYLAWGGNDPLPRAKKRELFP
jgi:hypothetical protein